MSNSLQKSRPPTRTLDSYLCKDKEGPARTGYNHSNRETAGDHCVSSANWDGMKRSSPAKAWAPSMTAAARFVRVAVMRRLASLVLLASLFVPAILASIPLWQSQSTSCGMACCKRSRVCCCRKSKAHEHGGVAWRADAKCCGGCGRASIVGPVVALQAEVQSRHAAEPVLTSLVLRSPISGVLRSAGAAFALFGRPPPSA